MQHSADPCGVFAYVPASALPLAKSRFAPPLEDCAFHLASALAPSRELCSRGGFAAKSGAHLAPFLRVSHFGRVRCSTLPRPRTEKNAPGHPLIAFGALKSASPLEDCAFRLASALAPSRELCSRATFAKNYIRPALEAGLIAMTDPDAPTSRNQRYYKI